MDKEALESMLFQVASKLPLLEETLKHHADELKENSAATKELRDVLGNLCRRCEPAQDIKKAKNWAVASFVILLGLLAMQVLSRVGIF